MSDYKSLEKEGMSGTKHDTGKPEIGLVSSKFIVGTAKVMTKGKEKYGAHQWRGGMPYSRLFNALQRHLLAWNDGEDLDPETGFSHLYHAAATLMMLCEQLETKPELDDRYKHGR